MALDHSGLYLENKFLENKSGQVFAFDKFTLQNLAKQIRGCVKQTFILFTHHYLSYRPRTECSISQFFQDKLHSVNIQDDQLWAFGETVEKISKITYTASHFSLLTSAKFEVNINRVMFQHK